MGSVQFKDISKVYPDGFQAVFDMNLEIDDGEFVILVGPSGCGKSTALRMVAGLEEITAGEMRIGGKVVNDMTPKERDIAMVFQSYALYPHMTVADNMGFALKLSKVPDSEIESRVREAAEILDLTEHLDRKPAALSGGQRQRVAMGRAIVRSPQAFLMDEPLSNLDAKLRVQMRAEIAELQNRLGVTTIYVTHDQVEAMTMGDRVAVLKRGKLQQAAPPQELYDNPSNLFVAGFIGSPAMNIAEGAVHRDGDQWRVQVGEARLLVGERALERYPRLKEFEGGKVAVGMRPEHFVRGSDVAEGDRWDGREVTLVEMLGAEMLVHFNTTAKPIVTDEMREAIDDDDAFARLEREAAEGGSNFIARFDPRHAPKPGDKLSVGFRPDEFHFFDIDGGTALR